MKTDQKIWYDDDDVGFIRQGLLLLFRGKLSLEKN